MRKLQSDLKIVLVITVLTILSGCAGRQHSNLASHSLPDQEFVMFSKAKTVAAYESYLGKYPQGRFANEARQNIEELRADQERRIELDKLGSDLTKLEEFVLKYPTGRRDSAVMEARRRIEEIHINDVISNGPGTRLIVPYKVASECPPSLNVCIGKITLGNGPSGMDALEFELPRDSVPFAGLGPLPLHQWGHGSVIRFKGKYTVDNNIFSGSETDSLSFMLVQDKGLVYLHGSGEVIMEGGNRIALQGLKIEK